MSFGKHTKYYAVYAGRFVVDQIMLKDDEDIELVENSF